MHSSSSPSSSSPSSYVRYHTLHQQLYGYVQEGSLQHLKALVASVTDDNIDWDWQIPNSLGYFISMLSAAVKCNDVQMVRYLLEQGASVDLADKHGFTPLVYANHKGQHSIVELLLSFGANVDHRDKFEETILIKAAERGFFPAINYLLQHGADINASDMYRETALMKASEMNHHSIVKLLLDVGADPTAKDQCGNTALTLCRDAHNVNIVHILETALNKQHFT